MSASDLRDAAAGARAFFENLAPADLERIAEVYAPTAYFRDPFNEVRGAAQVRRIFAHMFANLDSCRFEILETVVDDKGAFLTWDMTFRVKRWKRGGVQRIHGATHLRFDPAGRIEYHRDYWDVADELYAKLPLIGPVMRYLKRRLA